MNYLISKITYRAYKEIPQRLRRAHSNSLSVAPTAGRDKAGRSNFPHFAIRVAVGENAENMENADLLSLSPRKKKRRSRRGKSAHENKEKSANANSKTRTMQKCG